MKTYNFNNVQAAATISEKKKQGRRKKKNIIPDAFTEDVPVIIKDSKSDFYKEQPAENNFEENSIENSHNDFTKKLLAGSELQKDLIKAKAELCKKDFAYFIREFWDQVVVEKLEWNWHIDFLATELQKVAYNLAARKKKDKDVIINIPPGCSKSTICSILFPVYCWIVDPTISFISATHEQDLATRQSNSSRQLLKTEKFKQWFPHIQFKETQDNKTDYENKNGGYRVATSTKSSPTGRHALCIILDDPQNPDTAYSETERNNVNRWVSSTLSTRKTNKEVTITITVQQRLHPMDVTGALLEKEKEYNHIVLPGELNKSVKPSHLADKYIDGLLDPVRLKPETLHELRVDMGSKTFNTQINQLPQDEESSIIKEKWLNIIPFLEFQELIKDKPPVYDFFLDTAYTKKTNRDPSAILCCTKIDSLLYILNVSAIRYEFPKLIAHIKSWTEANGYTSRSKVSVEPKANGQSIVQLLRIESALNIIEGKSSKDDKITRLNAIAPTVESGKVVLVEGSWNNLFLSEVTAESPTHDDIRDCFVAAVETKMTGKPKNYGQYRISVL